MSTRLKAILGGIVSLVGTIVTHEPLLIALLIFAICGVSCIQTDIRYRAKVKINKKIWEARIKIAELVTSSINNKNTSIEHIAEKAIESKQEIHIPKDISLEEFQRMMEILSGKIDSELYPPTSEESERTKSSSTKSSESSYDFVSLMKNFIEYIKQS